MTLEFTANGGADALIDLTFDAQQQHQHHQLQQRQLHRQQQVLVAAAAAAASYPYTTTAHSSPSTTSSIMPNQRSWPLPLDMAATNNQGPPTSPEELHQATSPLSNTPSPHSQHSSL